ncbi:MAG: tetratricopeptide repeat protein, partial [Gammaproteobacteria bacterium]|nr:tetratricopeptide repeat protein [Gammaproteobacteria bacterium]
APSVTSVRYETEATGSQRSEGPVAELQRKALAALNQQNYQQSVEYLQRAIKIEPRNAFSWHYLAQTYWQSKHYDRCLDMLNRSINYSTDQDDLDDANATLMSQCQEG